MERTESADRRRKKLRKIRKILLSVLLTIVLLFTVDTILVHTVRRPIFCFPVGISDGGSCEFYDLGYQYVVWNKMDTVDGREGYWVGVELHSWFDLKRVSDGPGVALEFAPRQP